VFGVGFQHDESGRAHGAGAEVNILVRSRTQNGADLSDFHEWSDLKGEERRGKQNCIRMHTYIHTLENRGEILSH